jgi:hypothetical protein
MGFPNHCEAFRRPIAKQAARRWKNRLILRGFTVSTRGGFMKKQLFALFGLGLLLATASATAQTVALKANIPFNFVVTGKELPAGEYTIQPVDMQGTMLSISDSDLRPKSMVISIRCESLNRSPQTRLVFHRYGDRYFLAQIWRAGNKSGYELPKSNRETEVAQDYRVQNVGLIATLR